MLVSTAGSVVAYLQQLISVSAFEISGNVECLFNEKHFHGCCSHAQGAFNYRYTVTLRMAHSWGGSAELELEIFQRCCMNEPTDVQQSAEKHTMFFYTIM